MALGDKKYTLMDTDRGIPNGLATLDENGKIPQEQLGSTGGQNLLDNWYFVSPINQRGETSYNTADAYTIDRWRTGSSGGTVTVENGYITLGASGSILQRQPINLAGKTVTLSLLTASGLKSGTVTVPSTDGTSVTAYADSAMKLSISCSGLSSDSPITQITLENLSGSGQQLYAAKLELSQQQTLAKQDRSGSWKLDDLPPNPALELIKCQYYFERSVGQTLLLSPSATSKLDLGGTCYYQTPKRITPTITLASTQSLIVYLASNRVKILNTSLKLPSSYNQKMFTVMVSHASNGFGLGNLYQVDVSDGAYLIDAEL